MFQHKISSTTVAAHRCNWIWLIRKVQVARPMPWCHCVDCLGCPKSNGEVSEQPGSFAMHTVHAVHWNGSKWWTDGWKTKLCNCTPIKAVGADPESDRKCVVSYCIQAECKIVLGRQMRHWCATYFRMIVMKQSTEIWYDIFLRRGELWNVDINYNVDDAIRTFFVQQLIQSSLSGRVPWPLGWERFMGQPQLQRWHLHGLPTKTEHLSRRHVRWIWYVNPNWLY